MCEKGRGAAVGHAGSLSYGHGLLGHLMRTEPLFMLLSQMLSVFRKDTQINAPCISLFKFWLYFKFSKSFFATLYVKVYKQYGNISCNYNDYILLLCKVL